jgi:hypothetical protein
MRRAAVASVAFSVALGTFGSAQGFPTFYLSAGINPTGDSAWQTAVGSFVENDLDGFAHGSIVSSLIMGGVTVNVSLPNAPINSAEIFAGSYAGGGGQYGTVFNSALLNRSGGSSPADNEILFSFSTPVKGFGMWVFDNASGSIDRFEMTANGQTSGILDANPGQGAHIVEGFIGVEDPTGISSVIIRNRSGLVYFEVDHLQLAPIPEPSSLLLLGLGASAFAFRKRRKR